MGTYFYLSLKATNILQEEKKRKVVEKTLIESEKRFRVMFELSPVGIILIDEKGTIIEVNTSFCETLGYAREEIISKSIRLFTSPETGNEIENNISRILSGNTIIHEVKNIRKDGTSCVVELYETMSLRRNVHRKNLLMQKKKQRRATNLNQLSWQICLMNSEHR
jgi:PAS domain S-box-containing protein